MNFRTIGDIIAKSFAIMVGLFLFPYAMLPTQALSRAAFHAGSRDWLVSG